MTAPQEATAQDGAPLLLSIATAYALAVVLGLGWIAA